jgi:hypothetical protein
MKGEVKPMEDEQSTVLSRKRIAIRFLFTLFFVIVLEVLKIIIQVAVLFQYVCLFISTEYSDPMRRFSDRVSVYAYRVMRYIALNEDTRPFPFADFPEEIDPPEPEANF